MRPVRAQHYQHIYNETLTGQEFLESIIQNNSLSTEKKEQIKEARDSLIERMIELAKEHLTEKQTEVFSLYLDGKTQQEMALILKKCQSTIHKTMWGNPDPDRDGIVYGGFIRKLKLVCSNDQTCKDLLATIEELSD